jgi:CheY-like chemotaxis protein
MAETTAAAAMAMSGETPSALANDHRHDRVLVVDDNPVNQRFAVLLLRKFGYQVDAASNGQEALARLDQAAFDVVLLDVQMPEMDGPSVARQLVRDWPPARRPWLIALTGNVRDEERAECLAAGMDDFLSKPVAPETLRAALERARVHLAKRRGRHTTGEAVA